MSKWPMRGHFWYLRFSTFPMTSRTPQCEVFWALLSSSEHSGVLEDSKSPTLEVLGFTSHLAKVGLRHLKKINFPGEQWISVKEKAQVPWGNLYFEFFNNHSHLIMVFIYACDLSLERCLFLYMLATYHWKGFEKSYNFVFTCTSIKIHMKKLCSNKVSSTIAPLVSSLVPKGIIVFETLCECNFCIWVLIEVLANRKL
jgi:hypothetical protein